MNLEPYNKQGAWKVVIKETGRVVGSFRTFSCAKAAKSELFEIHLQELEITSDIEKRCSRSKKSDM